MGLFKMSDQQKAAGIRASDSLIERERKMRAFIEQKQANGEMLSPDELKTLEDYKKADARVAEIIAENREASRPHCPSCKSVNIQYLGQDRKSFSVGKAVGGAILAGGVGAIAGFAGKAGDYQWVCLNCGHRFELRR